MTESEFEFTHPAGLLISRWLTEREFLGTELSQRARRLDMGTGWVWYQLPSFRDGPMPLGMALAFESGVLIEISLGDATTGDGHGWAEWSEVDERARAARIGRWLSQKGFESGTYGWGSVWVGYDAKGGHGTASIRFAPAFGSGLA